MAKLQNKSQYKCLPFLTILCMALCISHTLMQNELFMTNLGLISFGSLFVPLYETVSDIISEIYGFRISIRFNWAANFVWLCFDLLCYLLIKLPSPNFFYQQKEYDALLGHATFVFLLAIIIGQVAYSINAYLLIKWKILFRGKYFWIRSFTSNLIGDVIFLTLMNPMWLWIGSVGSEKDAIRLGVSALVIRIFFYSILAFPSTIIVDFLKIIEQVDAYDHGIKFNPFKKENSAET